MAERVSRTGPPLQPVLSVAAPPRATCSGEVPTPARPGRLSSRRMVHVATGLIPPAMFKLLGGRKGMTSLAAVVHSGWRRQLTTGIGNHKDRCAQCPQQIRTKVQIDPPATIEGPPRIAVEFCRHAIEGSGFPVAVLGDSRRVAASDRTGQGPPRLRTVPDRTWLRYFRIR